MAALGNSMGFLLQPFDIFHGIKRHSDTLATTTSGDGSLKTEPARCLLLSPPMRPTVLWSLASDQAKADSKPFGPLSIAA